MTKCFNSTLQDFHHIKILSLRQCSFAFVRHIYTTNTLLVLNVKMRKTRPIYDNLVLNDENCLDGKANNFQLPQLNFGWRSTCAYLTVGERQCLNQAVVLQQLRVVLIKDQLSHLCPQINCSRVKLSVEHHRRKPLRWKFHSQKSLVFNFMLKYKRWVLLTWWAFFFFFFTFNYMLRKSLHDLNYIFFK